MKASGAGRRQAGSAHLRSIHIADITWLSPPQWATAAKQAKCRQTFGSAWVPHIRPPWGWPIRAGWWEGVLAGVGAQSQTCGQFSLLENAFPDCSGVETPELSPIQKDSLPTTSGGGGLALGFLDTRNVYIGYQSASSSPIPAP